MTKPETIILYGQFFMILALEMTNPFLPLLIASQTDATMQSAVFYSTLSLILPMIANILIAPIWGWAADRYGYKSMLMRACWALVFTQASMIFVNSVTWILIIRIMQGAFAGFIIAMQTYAVSISDWQNKSRQLSRLQSTKAIATTIAGFAGGMALTLSDYQGLYGVAAVICLIATIAMQYLLPVSSAQTIKRKPGKSDIAPHSKGIFYFLCALITLTQIAKFLPDPGLSLYLNHYFSNNWALIGFMYSLPALGMLCSSEWCGRQFDRCRQNPQSANLYLFGYSLLGCFLMMLQAFTINFYLFACIRILWGVVLAALLPALFALFSDRYSLPGYALGIANSFAKAGNLFGLLAGGFLASWLSYPAVFLMIAAIYGLFAVFVLGHLLLLNRQMSTLSTP
ncbi:MFS transporter [Legionella shakespearei]|uniref:Multidrug resistance efflux pump n=1 Tax=Legionella shakespearei DSM 23087 TaxID=1122169 RepID=A0A0W0YKY4_9GAMM|nr:MFS transporter [Legionella shakespearei]KTD57577.1 multidrug resistance efflux pump [Legionella shakespearei DSM 23087]